MFKLDMADTQQSRQARKARTPPRNRRMIIEPIKKVTIEFENGEIKTFDVPANQGFFRESYTYTDREGFTWKNKIKYHEIFWTYHEKDLKPGPLEPVKLIESIAG